MSTLRGKRVLVTRTLQQAEALVEKLSMQQAIPVIFPTIEIAPIADTAILDEAIYHLDKYGWVIFTSVNGVSAFWQRSTSLGKGSEIFRGIRVAAIGPATAQALKERGISPSFIPAEFRAEAILPGLGNVSNQHILLPRADIARQALVSELEKLGAFPQEIPVYRTVAPPLDPHALTELEKGVDIATFTSSSTVKNYFALLGNRAEDLLRGAVVVCIGPITAETARECGLAVDLVAGEYTIDGLIDALLKFYSNPSPKE
jgi:uroporphyrinogen III methyltransferase / synthase